MPTEFMRRRALAIALFVAPVATALVGAEPSSTAAARSAYAAAVALHNREVWDLATDEWRSFLETYPRDGLAPKARVYLGICQMKTGGWPAAVETFREVIKAGTDPEAVALARWELARGTFAAAQAEARPEAFRAAADRLREAVSAGGAQPQAAAATQLLGEALWQSGQKPEALASWRGFLKAHADSPLLPNVLYALGVAEAEVGADGEAMRTLARFAQEFPTHPLAADGALWRADLAARSGDLAGAEPILTALADAAPARAAEALDRLGDVRDRRGDRAGAIAAYTTLVRDHAASPLAARARLAAGRLMMDEGQADAARELLKAALAGGGIEGVVSAHLLARLALDADEPERALEAVAAGRACADALADRSALDADDLVRLDLDRGDALRRIPARRDEAVAAFDAISREHPESSLAARATVLGAATLLDRGRADAALERVEALLGRAAAHEDAVAAVRDARLVKAEAIAALDRASDAMTVLEQFVAELPDDPRAATAWFRLGELRQERPDPAAALDAFMRCRNANPTGPRAASALLAAGWCQSQLDRLPDAIATWTNLIEAHPDTVAGRAARLARADALLRRGDAKAALADVRALLAATSGGDERFDPAALGEARLLEAICLAATGDDRAAATTLETLLHDAPDAPVAGRALHELGLAQERLGDGAAAARAYATLVERFPQSPLAASAWLAAGEILWDDGDYAAARERYLAALEATDDPRGAIAERSLHKLGWTHLARGDHAAAVEAFTRQLATCPEGELATDGHALLGQELLALGRVDEARRSLATALLEPESCSSPELRAATYVRAAEAAATAGAWEESLDIARRFLAAEPGSPQAPQARYAAAWALQNLGRLDEARTRFAEIAAGPPTDLAARARLMEGEVLFAKGDHREAVKAFFKVAYGFGGEQAPAPFHPWQAQATFEAARCLEVLAKPDQARALYAELVTRYPDAEQVPAARQRLAALDAPGARP